MSDQRVETRVVIEAVSGEKDVGFQEYFVGHRHDIPVRRITLRGREEAEAAPGVLKAIADADGIVICPSNPIVSIGPILATGGIGEAVAARRDRAVAVSPIIAGRALKGPADRMMAELGHDPSVVGVARIWAPYAATLVIDSADVDRAWEVEAAGMHAVVTATVMSDPSISAALARTVLEQP
jgi:LPPG:FO 2-phospho-L-lactate transferase